MDEHKIKEKVNKVFTETELFGTPVEVVNMASFYGFSVYELEMDDSTAGMIIVDDKPIKNFNTKKLIVVNSNHSSTRKRFTVAHELGHYILENCPQKCYAHRDSAGKYNAEERDANSFASALLMPEDDIRKFVKSCQKKFGEDDFMLISRVAKKYNVSESAVSVRLNKLGIVL